jgi:hypothetical protein
MTSHIDLAERIEAADALASSNADPKSRLHRRIAAAKSLADDLADQGQHRMANVIRELCISAAMSSALNARLHNDLQAALRAHAVKGEG